MPDLDGLELAKKIRKINDVPIILYTGQGSEEVAEKAFSIGVNDYIRKEIDPSHYQVLLRRLKNIVENKRIGKLYFDVIEKARDALTIIVDRKLIYANQAFADLIGAKNPQEILGRDALKWVVPNKQKMGMERIRLRLSNEPVKNLYVTEICREDGKILKVEVSSTSIDYNGSRAILSFTRDISEREQLQEAIIKSEERLRSLVELAPDGIVTLNSRGTVTFVNPSFVKISGFQESEIVGKSYLNIGTLRARDLPKHIKTFSKILLHGMERPVEFVFKRKDNSEGIGEAHLKIIKNNNETELLGIVRDITERKKMEVELFNYSNKLENLAEERSKKLIEAERLVVAGRLASMVGHDLRGPLNTIKNAIYLIETRPEKTKDMIRIINNAIDMSVKLLDEVKTKTKDSPLELEEIEINQLLNSIIEETPIPPTINITLNIKDKAVVQVDKIKIRRVFDNLIRNSIEAMSNGGNIMIKTELKSDNIMIDIIDNGPGIPKPIMQNLFKPFYTTKEKGTGLGLSYCKQTIEAHNGSISVESKSRKGTAFKIILKTIKNTANDTDPKLIINYQTEEKTQKIE